MSVALEEGHGSALANAAFHGNVDSGKLLLDAAVDVNMRSRLFPERPTCTNGWEHAL